MEKVQCINPMDIQEGDLLAYVHGDAAPRVAEHVARCIYCAEQVEQLRMVDQRLFAAFYRDACPSPEVLADYALRRLPAPEQLRVAAHVRQCPACTAEIASVADLTGDAPPSLLERLRDALVTALVIHPVRQALTPARGAGWQSRFERGLLSVTVSSQARGLTGRVRRRAMSGAPAGDVATPEGDATLEGEAWLIIPEAQADEDVSRSSIDAHGRFHFGDIATGTYTLLLRVGEHHLAIQTVQVV